MKYSELSGMADLGNDCLTNSLQSLVGVMANMTHFNGKYFKLWSENVTRAIDSLCTDIVR